MVHICTNFNRGDGVAAQTACAPAVVCMAGVSETLAKGVPNWLVYGTWSRQFRST